MVDSFESEPAGEQSFVKQAINLPGIVRSVGGRALHLIRDSFDSQYHLENIQQEQDAKQLHEAVSLRDLEATQGNHPAVMRQNEMIVQILARSLARKIERGDEPVEDDVLRLKHVLLEIPEGVDIDSLGLSESVVRLVRRHL